MELKIGNKSPTGEIYLDGNLIPLHGAKLEMRWDSVPVLTIDLDVDAEGTFQGEIRLSDHTKKLLKKLGWTPPEDETCTESTSAT